MSHCTIAGVMVFQEGGWVGDTFSSIIGWAGPDFCPFYYYDS